MSDIAPALLTRPSNLAPCLLLALCLTGSGCDTTPVDDDDASADDDDTSNDDDAGDDDDIGDCGLASEGFGGSVSDWAWFEVDGFGTPGDPVPDYEIVAYSPVAPLDPAPVLLAGARRMPLERPMTTNILSTLGMIEFAEAHGWIVAMPLPGGEPNLNWSDSQYDHDYFRAAVGQLGDVYNIDLDRVFIWGSSAGGSATVYLGQTHADLVAGIADHAGVNPFATWPETPWSNDVAGLFIHDEDDPIVSRPGVQDAADMFEAAGQRVELFFDYEHGHEWVADSTNPAMFDFFSTVCNDG